MAYNAETAAANRAAAAEKAAGAPITVESLSQALLEALRNASQPEPPPAVDIVTIGQTSDPNMDRLVFCPDCLGRDGPSWGSHEVFWLANDPERPGRIKRVSYKVAHPQVPKTISYDANTVRKGLDAGTHGKQCLQCGAVLHRAA